MVMKSRNLSNDINLLSKKLEKAGCLIIHARGDADLLIVKTAVESARSTDTILVGDDTDLLVLLIYHAEMNGKSIHGT